MYRSDHQVKSGKYLVAVVQASIVQDIAFDTFENKKWGQFSIQLINIYMLLPDALFRKSVCIKRRLAMVADDQVFKSLLNTGFCHFFHCLGAIAPVAMTVNDAF